MTHLDSSALATYNSLADPHLQCFFSSERIRSHLKHAGLIGRRGEVVSDSEYRMKLVRREHKKHVRQMLAENIVHRAIDMERARQAELRRQLDIVSKAALVNSVKESRRRTGHSTGNVGNSYDMVGQSVHSSWSQTRPRSASHHHELQILNEELSNQPRVQSAHVHYDQRRKHASKSPVRRSRYLNRPKSSSAQRLSPTQRSHSPTKSSDPPCQIKMIYYGPHTKIDYDHSLFEPVDEIIVMQQHCGGENLIVYKDHLKAGEEFQFNSRRHADFPFGLSLYVKGLIDSRISTCCEYKHRHGVRLGGERGHFAIISVEGSQPCIKCRFAKQSQLKQYGDANDTDEENRKAITISIPVSDQPRNKQTPVKIPVRPTSNSNENYSDDFDGSEKQKQKANQTRSKSPTESSSTSTMESEEESSTKTWQVIFYTSNIPTGSFNPPKKPSSTAVLKFSFLSMDGDDETEEYSIQMKEFPSYFKSSRQDSFPAKLRNIGKPKQIRLKLEVTGQEKNEDIKWHLDHIELIDPKTQSHYKFPCNQWIRPSEEKLLNNSDSIRKNSTSTNSSKSSIHKKPSPTTEQKSKTPSRSSSSSSSEPPKRYEIVKKPIITEKRRISTDTESNDQNKVHYQITIYPSKDTDGEFDAMNDSRITLRLNNQTKDSFLFKKGTKYCPSFESGAKQTFEIDLRQNTNEKPTKLTIGYYNTDISAGKWKLEKIVLINTKTDEETTFVCQQTLVRNDFNLRAEQTFQAQSDDDEQSTPRNVITTKHIKSDSSSDDDIKQKPIPPIQQSHKRSDSDEDTKQKPIQPTKQTRNQSDSDEDTKKKPVQPIKYGHNRTSSSESSEKAREKIPTNSDEHEQNPMYKTNNSNTKVEPNSSSSRPKTRRGREDTFDKDIEQANTTNNVENNNDVWRPSSGLKKDAVDPLVGLEDAQDQTARSNDQKNLSSNSDNTDNKFKNWYLTTADDEDED